MRFLQIAQDGTLKLTKEATKPPGPYAILSHTWGDDGNEVTFDDLKNQTGRDKSGYTKLWFCTNQAKKDGLCYSWVDTCCINRANHSELSEAITSMFRWYLEAKRCYVYLSDVSRNHDTQDSIQQASTLALRQSRWFTRGWTLQELLAPVSVEFFSIEQELLGSKETLKELISERTGIPVAALQGAPLTQFSVEERLQWSVGRDTRKVEDKAYCLLGIFQVYMSLNYGEGEHAFIRLRNKIRKQHDHLLESSYPQWKRARSSSALSTLREGRRVPGCGTTCLCICHLPRYYETPVFLKRLLGSVKLKRSCPLNARTCVEAHIWLPQWLAQRNIFILLEILACGSPRVGLKVQRRVPWGGDDSILRFALIGDMEGVRDILFTGKGSLDDIDPNHGRSALHYAVQKNQIGICKFLLHAGADPEMEDATSMTPSQKAWEHILTHRGSPSQLRDLRQLFPEDLTEWSFSHLHLVIFGIRPLLLAQELDMHQNRAFINARDATGRTPLHWAASMGNVEVVGQLLRSGAIVDARDSSNSTPLLYASSTGNVEILRILVDYGADVSSCNSRGDTALHFASRHKTSLEPVKFLIERGAVVDARNKVGNTPLAGSAMMNRVDIGRFLLSEGADMCTRGMYGDTPLFEAIYHNSHEFLEMLVNGGAGISDTNAAGRTILHAAALEADNRTIEILAGADIGNLSAAQLTLDGLTPWAVFQRRSMPPDKFGEAFKGLLERCHYDSRDGGI